MWGVSLTCPMLFYVWSFFYTPHAVSSGEFLLKSYTPLLFSGEFFLHTPWCFMCGVSLTHPMLFYVWSFSYTPHGVLCVEFLLHTSSCSMWRLSLTRPLLIYVGIFLLHAPSCFMWGVSLTRPFAVLSGEFLLHAPSCFMWGVSFTWPMLFYVGNFSYTLRAVLLGGGGGVLLHYWCLFLCMKFVFHALCCFISGISPLEFLFHTLCKFMWGDFPIACPVFFRVKIFIYSILPILFYVRNLS